MEKIKILEVLDCYYPSIDGPINVVKNYSKDINKDDECTLAVPSASKKTNYIDNEEFEVWRCKSISAPDNYRYGLPEFDKEFKKKIKKESFDIVHTHSPFSMGRFALKLSRKKRIPLVATLHTQYKKDFVRVLHFKPFVWFMTRYIMKVYNRADSVWTVNDASRQVLRDYGYKGKIEVVRNGTDFVYPANANELIEKVNALHNLHNQKNVFIFVGRIAMYKNLKLIADSLKILKDKGEDFKMIVIGNGADYKKYVEMINELGLSDNFIFTGSIQDRQLLSGYYLRSDLFLFPSTFDTSSLVPVEAAAHKLPTLLIKGSYTAENIIDNENGFLIEENTEKFANRILEIINNQELMKNVGENAHKTIYRTWDMVAKDVSEKYREIIKEYKQKHKK